ncbi:MAG: transposase [Candidatus Omnitrophica bacterium]|nr:transposase [Candidatus Omnitrophota bacterium]
MARVSRNELLYKDCYAHVISRSIRKMKIFNDEEDFIQFKYLLLQAKKIGQFRVYHYCAMQTHFHLAVQMGDVSLFANAIRDLKRSYVYWFHTKYKISGPIWRERYRSLLIEDENYLYTCGLYIENNPVKAGLVQQSDQWAHSSSRYYIRGSNDVLVDEYERDVCKMSDIMLDEEDFEKGSVIGSSFFRFQFYDRRKRS